jgi:hypothetical protein
VARCHTGKEIVDYQTTYYHGNRNAARAHAQFASDTVGGATYLESVGLWNPDDDERLGTVTDDGAIVIVLHRGGPKAQAVAEFARTLATIYEEDSVLAVTSLVESATFLESYNGQA